jgi:hypothetical protein
MAGWKHTARYSPIGGTLKISEEKLFPDRDIPKKTIITELVRFDHKVEIEPFEFKGIEKPAIVATDDLAKSVGGGMGEVTLEEADGRYFINISVICGERYRNYTELAIGNIAQNIEALVKELRK